MGGIQDLACLFTAFAVFWATAFYAIVHSETSWGRGLPGSSKASENCKYMKARNVLGILHAALVSFLVLPPLWMVAGEHSSVLFASSEHLVTCMQTEHPSWNHSGQAVALAGLLFTAFLSADIIISCIHNLASWDYVVHHVAFIAAGLIIRSHCMLPYNAAVLLAMEASTPFLNVMLFFRNRGPSYSLLVQVSGIVFVMLFVLFRLVLNTYAAIFLWRHRTSAMPQAVPEWQRCFLLGAIAAGSALQFFWFPAIARIFCKGLMNLLVLGSPRATNSTKCGSSSSNSSSLTCMKGDRMRSSTKEAVVHRKQTPAEGSGVAKSNEDLRSPFVDSDCSNEVLSQARGGALRSPSVASSTSIADRCPSSSIRYRRTCGNRSTSVCCEFAVGPRVAEEGVY